MNATVICMFSLALAAPPAANKPTLFIVSDSTVHNGTRGQQGWGDPLIDRFDHDKITVENRAIGGRSSRTFQTEGRWDAVLKKAKRGDFVLIQMGHNDAGKINDDFPPRLAARHRRRIARHRQPAHKKARNRAYLRLVSAKVHCRCQGKRHDANHLLAHPARAEEESRGGRGRKKSLLRLGRTGRPKRARAVYPSQQDHHGPLRRHDAGRNPRKVLLRPRTLRTPVPQARRSMRIALWKD